MKKVLLALVALALLLVYINKTNSGFRPPTTVGNPFVALCPPGQMPASYTDTGGSCVQYVF